MAVLRVVSWWIARFRAQRWNKEILLAIALTLAAAAFIVAATIGNDGHVHVRAPYANADR